MKNRPVGQPLGTPERKVAPRSPKLAGNNVAPVARRFPARTKARRSNEVLLLIASGKQRAHRYFAPLDMLKAAGLDQQTTLKRVPPHRLRALVLEDLERYPDSAISAIHRRIGSEISGRAIKRALDQLIDDAQVEGVGERRWRTYRLAPAIDHKTQEKR